MGSWRLVSCGPQTTIKWGEKAEPFQGLSDWRLQLALLGAVTVLAYWWLW